MSEMRNEVVRYFFENYFGGNIEQAIKATGYTHIQFRKWLDGSLAPQKNTIEYIAHCIFTPEFRRIAEYYEFHPEEKIMPQLKNMLGGHADNPGIYAFYDSMGNLLYIGKAATSLIKECYQSIRQEVSIKFPSGIKNAPQKRYEITKYISAYDVGNSNWIDYPKHVESLILRISKPPLNKIIGSLEPAFCKEDEC
ncbi:hypothetical protein SAMN05216601_113103 [Ectopseudomonas composti]|uniref:Uncharacterized protein n=1 Tax=Ectopseudomonas composti TaxID=658457 RepID=A0A1I5QY10_9GAMM|nr:hypothetical protein [Pseudomonas composti]SFP51158.1 hypothetical protein SAMN05216601_113103 [Pseudomonas composti]